MQHISVIHCLVSSVEGRNGTRKEPRSSGIKHSLYNPECGQFWMKQSGSSAAQLIKFRLWYGLMSAIIHLLFCDLFHNQNRYISFLVYICIIDFKCVQNFSFIALLLGHYFGVQKNIVCGCQIDVRFLTTVWFAFLTCFLTTMFDVSLKSLIISCLCAFSKGDSDVYLFQIKLVVCCMICR